MSDPLMDQNSTSIKHLLEASFPLDKLRSDLLSYLDYMNYPRNSNGEYIISVPNIDNNIAKEQCLSPLDTITIIKYLVSYSTIVGMHHTVIVGIGNFVEHSNLGELFSIEKCLVNLRYNDDFSCFDAEIYTESLYTP